MSVFANRKKPAPADSAREDSRPDGAEPALFVAVVHANDGVRFMTAAESRWELVHQLAAYVKRWGGYVLPPDHARRLRSLLARGEWEAAVELYFGLVGKRWDKEWLVTAVVPSGDKRDTVAVLGEVASPDALHIRHPPGDESRSEDEELRGLYLDP